MRPEDDGFWQEGSRTPVPQYCTPEDVETCMDLPDPSDSQGYYRFTDMSHPSYDQVCRFIVSNEDRIDRRTRRSWRVNHVKDYVTDIPQYQWDEVAFRTGYFANGGNVVQLHKDILPWDPSKGDRILLRRPLNAWTEQSDMHRDDNPLQMDLLGPDNFWFDYPKGRLFLRTRRLQPKYNALCISYRYGYDGPVPEGIRRLCCLLTSIQIMQSQMFSIKLGLGGDISGIKDSLIEGWQTEANELYSSYQRSGSVHGVPHR